jgi:hypothetical protein
MIHKILRYLKRQINIYTTPRYYKDVKQMGEVLRPVFVLGTNRSGTSLITSILAQHPQLEGLFAGHTVPTMVKETNHVRGYCESYHLWSWLNSDSSYFRDDDPTLWCHPKNVSSTYREAPRNDWEALCLGNSIQRYRQTVKIPLIKDQLNLLRIPLIKRAFPFSKFVLVWRNYDEYIKSCRHGWYEAQGKSIRDPLNIGLHWYIGNSTAYYDLLRLAEKDHTVINYNKFISSVEYAAKAMDEIVHCFGLNPFQFNFQSINEKYRFILGEAVGEFNGNQVKDIAQFENSMGQQ